MINELFSLANQAGVAVEYGRLPLNESMSIYGGDGDFILMDYSLLSSSSNELAHLAHELGHCMTGSFYNPYSKLDIRGKHEYRANKWAYQQLLPYDDLMIAVSNGYTEVWEIAEYFELPEEFTAKAMLYYREQEMAAM